MKNKITLACIAGNAERYIGRFLDSFQKHFDEVIVVRAIGNQSADSTIDIAQKRGCVVGAYYNLGHPANGGKDWGGSEKVDWPHVDDFAAARNKAFDLASNDWIMWADMDDMIDDASAAAIRDAIERMPDDCDGLEVAYQVPEDGITVFRERVIRKGKAKWVSPIHEHLVFDPDAKLARINNAKIVHAATGSRQANDERNLRILESIPKDERTTSHRFHLFQSLRVCGREEEAVAEAVDMLANPPADMGSAERYELFIAVGQVTKDSPTRANLILQALGTDPTRREAFGEMAICMIGMGKPKEALGWTTAMRAIKPSKDRAWNARAKYYGWLGETLHGMALRANGRIEEGDAVETNHFIRNGAMISLIHATRGRARSAAHCRRKWLEDADNPDAIEHIFGLDIDDPEAILLTVHNHVFTGGTSGPVAAWNAAAEKSKGAILVQLSDDWEPFQGWDTAILDAIGDLSKPAVLAVSDGHRTDDLLCMAILTRARYKQQGYLFHPEFFSMYSDDWFSECAFDDGVVIDARDRIRFEHIHPAFGKGEMDATYARSNAEYRYRTGFGILKRLRQGIKVSAEIDGWMDFRDVYDYVAATLPDDGFFVEVGSWKGKSAVYLVDRLDDLGKRPEIMAVDTFAGDDDTGFLDVLPEFKANIGHRAITVEFGDSVICAAGMQDGMIDGIFIDAAHDYESVKADIAAWLPKVKPGGFFGGHDIDSPGVLQAVTEAGFEWEKVGRCWIKKP